MVLLGIRPAPVASWQRGRFCSDGHPPRRSAQQPTQEGRYPGVDITTTDDFIGIIEDHPDAGTFVVLGYADGAVTRIPHNLFRGWHGQDMSEQDWPFEIGRGTLINNETIVRLSDPHHKVSIGNWSAIGQRVRFLLGGVHRTRTAAIADFNTMTWPRAGVHSPYPSSPASTISVGHDVWVGDEAFVMMGTDIATGCVVGARSVLPAGTTTEPYGVYVGSPARLVRFRFTEAVRAALLDLAWWDLPVRWMRENNHLFMTDLAEDEAMALETLAALSEAKEAWLAERAALAIRPGDPAPVI